MLYFMQNISNTQKGVCMLNKYQERTVYISIVALAFFLVLSLITHNWGFFLWSILPVFIVLMSTFFTNRDKKENRR